MRLAAHMNADQLSYAIEAFYVRRPSVEITGLELASLGNSLALVPIGDDNALAGQAAVVVTELIVLVSPRP
ncbi:DUF1045 domain-containing protein [Flavimaricola marinus]|uniref:DUF1045 domain-containing protein n=1 Tax=Flavimaricola marinus TaxID=1819565 RepID=UPI0035222077